MLRWRLGRCRVRCLAMAPTVLESCRCQAAVGCGCGCGCVGVGGSSSTRGTGTVTGSALTPRSEKDQKTRCAVPCRRPRACRESPMPRLGLAPLWLWLCRLDRDAQETSPVLDPNPRERRTGTCSVDVSGALYLPNLSRS